MNNQQNMHLKLICVSMCVALLRAEQHLLLQSVLSGPGYCQCMFSSLQLFQLLLQMFHCYLQRNVKVKATASFSGHPDMRVVT